MFPPSLGYSQQWINKSKFVVSPEGPAQDCELGCGAGRGGWYSRQISELKILEYLHVWAPELGIWSLSMRKNTKVVEFGVLGEKNKRIKGIGIRQNMWLWIWGSFAEERGKLNSLKITDSREWMWRSWGKKYPSTLRSPPGSWIQLLTQMLMLLLFFFFFSFLNYIII